MKKILLFFISFFIIFNSSFYNVNAAEHIPIAYELEDIADQIEKRGYAIVSEDFDVNSLPNTLDGGLLAWSTITGWGSTALVSSELLPVIGWIIAGGILVYNLPTLIELAQSIYNSLSDDIKATLSDLKDLKNYIIDEILANAMADAFSNTMFQDGNLITSLDATSNFLTYNSKVTYDVSNTDLLYKDIFINRITDYGVFYPIPGTTLQVQINEDNTIKFFNSSNGLSASTLMDTSSSFADIKHVFYSDDYHKHSYSISKPFVTSTGVIGFYIGTICDGMKHDENGETHGCSKSVRYWKAVEFYEDAKYRNTWLLDGFNLPYTEVLQSFDSYNGKSKNLIEWSLNGDTLELDPPSTVLGHVTGLLDDRVIGYETDEDVTGLQLPVVGDTVHSIPLDIPLDTVDRADVITGEFDDTTSDLPSDTPSDGIFSGLFEWLKSILDAIVSLTNSLIEALKDLLIYLFVPSEADLVAMFEMWKALLSDVFGGLYQVFELIINFAKSFSYSNQSSILFPKVSIPIGDTFFIFGGWDVKIVPDKFAFLFDLLKTLSSIVATFAFVNGLKSRFEKLLGGSSNI